MSNLGKRLDKLPDSGELDELIEDTSLLIASVYNMLDHTHCTPQQTTQSLDRRAHNNSGSRGQHGGASFNSNSPKSPKTPRLSLTARTTLSTPSSREIDREVNRIDQFCEMLEHNLRTAALEQEQLFGRPPGSMSPTTPPQERNRMPTLTPDEVIDLSDSMSMPPPTRRSYPLDVSDDVIIVTPSDEEVVDLCTPNFRRNRARARNRRHANAIENRARDAETRRQYLAAVGPLSSTSRNRPSFRHSLSSTSSFSLAQLQNEDSSSGSTISITTSTTNIGTTKKEEMNVWSASGQVEDSDAGVTSESGRVPFMCAICMDSCVNNQPTSTKCGHVFCGNCIHEAVRLTRKCPMCKAKISPTMLFRIYI